jgi:hypothetical protein
MTEPRIIDLAFAMEGADGARFYAPPLQAAAIQSGAALGELWCEYPRQTGAMLIAAAWAAVTGYFLHEAFHPSKPRRRARAK